MPEEQTIHPQPGEVADWLWIGPSAALDGDRLTLVHATRRVLAAVAGEPDLERLISGFQGRSVKAVQVEIRQLEDGSWELITPA
jgi:hypothetical protein